MCNNGGMRLSRKVPIWRLAAALGILLAEIIFPVGVLRTSCIFYSAPVVVLSNFAWLEPEFGEKV